jgi:2-polyprenyl-3-methyl-5-hydroxy-6-metoxy-1,4-benzoquinol methylase
MIVGDSLMSVADCGSTHSMHEIQRTKIDSIREFGFANLYSGMILEYEYFSSTQDQFSAKSCSISPIKDMEVAKNKLDFGITSLKKPIYTSKPSGIVKRSLHHNLSKQRRIMGMSNSSDIFIAEENNFVALNQAAISTPASRLQKFLDEALVEKPALRLLEAGCGSASELRFPGNQVHITGIDISQKQLERNQSLNVRIQADIQYYAYQPLIYDVIVCYWVLEHLQRPDLALRGFALTLTEGGLVVLAIPNILSVKGLLTKYTPFTIHSWVYKHLHGRQTSGQDDTGPFRTYLRYSIRPNAIRRFAEHSGLQVVYFATSDILDAPWAFTGSKLARVVRAIYGGLKYLAKVTSLGLLGDSDFYMVLQKRR